MDFDDEGDAFDVFEDNGGGKETAEASAAPAIRYEITKPLFFSRFLSRNISFSASDLVASIVGGKREAEEAEESSNKKIKTEADQDVATAGPSGIKNEDEDDEETGKAITER